MGRGWVYWVTIGWLWEPVKWLGRVAAWVVFWPVGLWRSIVHGGDKRRARDRRREA